MNKRRRFLKNALLFGIAPVVLSNTRILPSRHPKIIKPKRLKKGDTVGLVAPASGTFENEDIHFAADIVKSLGFKVLEGKHLYDKKGYLAGEDEHRAKDLNGMFANKDVAAIIALRGGFGSPRILPYLDFELIGKNPKVILGYSDITALLHAIHGQTGLITFHGPIAGQTFSEYTLAAFKKVLMDPEAPTLIGAPPPLRGGRGRGGTGEQIGPYRARQGARAPDGGEPFPDGQVTGHPLRAGLQGKDPHPGRRG